MNPTSNMSATIGWVTHTCLRIHGLASPGRREAVANDRGRRQRKLRALSTLVETSADGELWILLQHVSIRTLHQVMVAFYDFGATVPIDPDLVSAVIGTAPKSVRLKEKSTLIRRSNAPAASSEGRIHRLLEAFAFLWSCPSLILSR